MTRRDREPAALRAPMVSPRDPLTALARLLESG